MFYPSKQFFPFLWANYCTFQSISRKYCYYAHCFQKQRNRIGDVNQQRPCLFQQPFHWYLRSATVHSSFSARCLDCDLTLQRRYGGFLPTPSQFSLYRWRDKTVPKTYLVCFSFTCISGCAEEIDSLQMTHVPVGTTDLYRTFYWRYTT